MTDSRQTPSTSEQRTIPTTVPDSDPDPVRCLYCERPFQRETLRDLHVGEEHPDVMTATEADQFEKRVDEEGDELFVLHLKVVGAVVLLFFAIAYLYAFVLSG